MIKQERIDLEASIACCLLLSEGKEVNSLNIEAEDFEYLPAKLVVHAAKENNSIDPMICRVWGKEKGYQVSFSELSSLLNVEMSSKQLFQYAKRFKKMVYQQKLEQLKVNARLDLKTSKNVVELCQEITYKEGLLRLKYLDEDSPTSLLDACADLMERIDKREANTELVKTGWDLLDDLFGGGFLPNELVVIAARPSVGKTAMALQLACSGQKGVLFALEMDNKQIAPRLLAQVSKHNTIQAARNPSELCDYLREKFLEKTEDLFEKASKLIVYDDHDQNMATIRRRARKEVENGARFIIIDYLQLLDDEKEKSRERAVAKISRVCKNMAKELNAPVFLLAQLNRACEIEKRPPEMRDLRESGAIEQDANGIIFLYQVGDSLANDDGSFGSTKRVMFKLAKGRDVGTGLKQSLFNANHQTFYEEHLELGLLNSDSE